MGNWCEFFARKAPVVIRRKVRGQEKPFYRTGFAEEHGPLVGCLTADDIDGAIGVFSGGFFYHEMRETHEKNGGSVFGLQWDGVHHG